MEVNITKQNIEKHNEIWKDHKIADLWKNEKHQEMMYQKLKQEEIDWQKMMHFKEIKRQQRNI